MKNPEFGSNRTQSFIDFFTTVGKVRLGLESFRLYYEYNNTKVYIIDSDGNMLPDNVVTTNKILDGNVTVDKLASSLDLVDHALSNLKIEEGTPVNAVAARGTLTVTAGGNQIADTNTVTIGTKVYTFKTVLTPAEGEVLIGANDTAALLNLKNAINHTGTPDTDYSCAAVHPTVTGISSSATTLIVAAKTAGTAGNIIPSTETGAELSWDDDTLGTTVVGVDGTIGSKYKILTDATNLYIASDENTVSGANWKKLVLQAI